MLKDVRGGLVLAQMCCQNTATTIRHFIPPSEEREYSHFIHTFFAVREAYGMLNNWSKQTVLKFKVSWLLHGRYLCCVEQSVLQMMEKERDLHRDEINERE